MVKLPSDKVSVAKFLASILSTFRNRQNKNNPIQEVSNSTEQLKFLRSNEAAGQVVWRIVFMMAMPTRLWINSHPILDVADNMLYDIYPACCLVESNKQQTKEIRSKTLLETLKQRLLLSESGCVP